MDISSVANAVNEEHLQVEKSNDSCRFQFTEILTLAGNTDGSFTTECGWSAEVKQENSAVVKREPDDVRCVICISLICYSSNNCFET